MGKLVCFETSSLQFLLDEIIEFGGKFFLHDK
jgi:hypothetical protein